MPRVPRHVRRLTALALLLGLGGLPDAAVGDKGADLTQWPSGPVRYIAEKEEIRVFKQLRSDSERALFVERFWARRDPSPGTLANEYRQLFWERVKEANDRFRDSPRPGWTTDRGKIHILYGPPTKIEEHEGLNTHSAPTSGHGLIRWVYEGRPGDRIDLDPVVIVPFERLATGEYRVSYDPKLSSVFFDALAVEEQRDRAFDRFREIFGAPRPTEMSVMLDLGRMQEVPPHARVLMEQVETAESYATRSIEVLVSRYVRPDGRSPVIVVTVDVGSGEADPAPAVIARFRPTTAPGEPRMLGEDAFKVAGDGRHRVAQGRLQLSPGGYELTVLLADPKSAATGMYRASVEVPQPGGQLRLSDPLWALELSPLEFVALASHDEPFIVGPFRVVPRVQAVFAHGETLKLFFEIYGGTLPYKVSYQVRGLDVDGSWVDLGRPATTVQPVAAQGWELPTSASWPPGDYQVQIDVEDGEERLASVQLPFRLLAATPSSATGAAPEPRDAP
jgi:GWxTD domain-containing protein